MHRPAQAERSFALRVSRRGVLGRRARVSAFFVVGTPASVVARIDELQADVENWSDGVTACARGAHSARAARGPWAANQWQWGNDGHDGGREGGGGGGWSSGIATRVAVGFLVVGLLAALAYAAFYYTTRRAPATPVKRGIFNFVKE